MPELIIHAVTVIDSIYKPAIGSTEILLRVLPDKPDGELNIVYQCKSAQN